MADYIYTMETRLTPDQQKGVSLVQDVARAAGMNLYLTGGAVRDIISGFPIRDLDFTVQGNPLKLQKELEKQWPKKVHIVSITVDPDHDTPQVLKAYAEKFHVQPGWQFLTGRRADIDHIRRELGLYYPEDTQFEHMNMITIGREPTGQWITMRALNRPDVIAYTVRRLIPGGTGPDHHSALSRHSATN